jgi:hypothetical protein
MTTTTILIVSGIASALLLFAGVLAWGDYYSRGARRDQNDAPSEPAKSAVTVIRIERRDAA